MEAHHLALSSLITLSFFLAILPPSYCTDDARFVECSRPFECGRINDVFYPFWGGNRPEYCGRQGFKLECYEDKYPIITFEGQEFLILNISESQNIMTIARLDLLHGFCPQIYNDTVLNYNIFDYASIVLNITLFYDCSSQVITSIPVQNRFTCSLLEGSDANNNAYFVNESLAKIHIRELEKCRGRIRFPILRNAIDESAGVVPALQEVLNRGFDVDYNPLHDTAYNGCMESDGNCGYNNETHQFVCFCRDGERSHYCPELEWKSLGTPILPNTLDRRYSYLLILFFFINSLGTNSSSLLTTCPTHYCGNVIISYPFWVRNEIASDQQYCGYKGFGVMCLNGEAVLRLSGDQYYVKDINYTDYTLTLVDIDVTTNQTCPRPRQNVSLETPPLKYSSMDLNLSFYFNCTSDPLITVPSIQCLNIGSNQSYVFVENNETEGFDWSKNCEEKMVVAVTHSQINMGNLTGGFGGAMNDGFVLDWERVKDCGTCESSEGYCGYDATAEEYLCFCSDGTINSNNCKGMLSVILMAMRTDMHGSGST